MGETEEVFEVVEGMGVAGGGIGRQVDREERVGRLWDVASRWNEEMNEKSEEPGCRWSYTSRRKHDSKNASFDSVCSCDSTSVCDSIAKRGLEVGPRQPTMSGEVRVKDANRGNSDNECGMSSGRRGGKRGK